MYDILFIVYGASLMNYSSVNKGLGNKFKKIIKWKIKLNKRRLEENEYEVKGGNDYIFYK